MDHIIEIKRECPSCRGTGLFKGMAEREGFAVVCHNCHGKGWNVFKLQYNDPPVKRLPLFDVDTVLEFNPGIVCGSHPTLQLPSFGGMPYADWVANKPFPPGSEMRNYTCPTWWYQGTDYKKKPTWDECGMMLGDSFSNCKCFPTKDLCWNRWDKENECDMGDKTTKGQ